MGSDILRLLINYVSLVSFPLNKCRHSSSSSSDLFEMVAICDIYESHKSFQDFDTKLVTKDGLKIFINYSVLTSKSLHLSMRGVIDFAEKNPLNKSRHPLSWEEGNIILTTCIFEICFYLQKFQLFMPNSTLSIRN